MIKSSRCSLKFANDSKLESISLFIDEYKRITQEYVNLLWEKDKIGTYLTKKETELIDTWLSVRIQQCAGKQASGIVRGTKRKLNQQLYIYNKLNSEGRFKQARRLKKKINLISKPKIQDIQPELDSRFVKIGLINNTTFDGWIKLGSLGNKLSLNVPFKKTKHFNKLQQKGLLKAGIRLSNNNITFMFEMEEPVLRANGLILGLDIGKNKVYSCSNGITSLKNKHGYDLNKIIEIMNRKKKGSKNFKKCVAHRTNYTNWTVNQLNFNGVKQLNIEKIKDLRKNKRTSRNLSHWTYTDIFNKIKSTCQEQGVLVNELSPSYTSQRCSKCGWVHKRNRVKEVFKCRNCGFATDADINASINISFNLPSLNREKCPKDGFFWNSMLSGREPIVPATQKTHMDIFP